ncbi:MAG: hypothetical protein EPO40_37110 [Myxococcaceae bacterium]|nr:MAG: hypothetical protein EPO40_37110 [Myxococcaceae bacterium]
MSDAHRHASGAADAPLAATRRYSFTRVVTAAGEAKLTIPFCQRGSWDDFGIVEHPEQEVFVHRLLASLGVAVRSGYPGEFVFPDVASLERAWAALEAAIQAPAAAPPADGRDVSASAAIDARSGGDLSVTVHGVLDAPALADRFVAVG